jgi:alpha-tubulin suppressor-like RCC1 family protein
MARRTSRTRSPEHSGAYRLLPALLATALLALGLLSASAWAESPLSRFGAGAAADVVRDAETLKAPKITKNPVGQTVEEGQTVVFEAAASGVPTPTVQWEVTTNEGATWSPVPGGTSDDLVIASAKTSESGDVFRATFTNSVGSVTGEAVRLVVHLAPAVTKQPVSVTVEEGQNAVFEVAGVGFPEPSVQWEVSVNGGGVWTGVAGGTSDQLTIAKTKTSENGSEYRATYKNSVGTATSHIATLTVQLAPAVTRQPLDATVEEGQSAVFEASGSGFPTPSEQWEISTDAGASWSPVAGATEPQLIIASATIAENGSEYRGVFTNAAGKVTSNVATLTVHRAPTVTEQPAGVTVEIGQAVVFEATGTGSPTPSEQWELSTDGGSTWSAVAGATSDRLTVANAELAESGDEYRAVFANVAGTATSEVATLTVAAHHYRVLGWGQNTYGQLGDGSLTQSDTPIPATGLNFVTAVAAGRRHGLALLANGTVAAWGYNASGQLGDGTFESSDVPVAVQELADVTAIAAGSNHSLALLSNGTVMAWGANESGQLGDGSSEGSELPVAVKGLTGVMAIAAGAEYSLALLKDGTVMAWGRGEHGQLGDGDANDSEVPVAVKGLTGVTAIAAGGECGLALLSDGTVRDWGDNEYGQLGNLALTQAEEEQERESEEEFSDVPVPVEGLSGVTAITAGARHSLALLGNGTVMAWGENKYGELGDGAIGGGGGAPSEVSGLAGVSAVAAGGEHSLALLGNGTVMAWGEDKYGELGNGSVGEPSDVPVAITGLHEATAIAAGGYQDLVLSEPIPIVTSISPSIGPATGGAEVTITGSNFEEATVVSFGAHSATSYTINSPTTITAIAPAGALGTVDVTVSRPAGRSATVPADRFTYLPAPTVKKLAAKDGPGSGGSEVTITGTNFQHVIAVDFGAAAASSVTVRSSSSITAVSPAGAGTVNVTVVTVGGTSATTTKDEFEYRPAVEAVAPSAGSPAGGESVAITGDGFVQGAGMTTFKFGKKLATDVYCTSNTSCTALTPASKAGGVEVVATVGKLKSPDDPPGDRFTYE